MDSFDACPKCQQPLSPPISGGDPCPHCGAYPFKVLEGAGRQTTARTARPAESAPSARRAWLGLLAVAGIALALAYRATAVPGPVPPAPAAPAPAARAPGPGAVADAEDADEGETADAPAAATPARRALSPVRVTVTTRRFLPATEVGFTKAANVPTLNYYYDPANQPVATDAIGALQRALAAWSAVCNVNAAYGGIARGRIAGATVVRWDAALAAQSVSGVTVAGKGTVGPGAILLNPDLLGRYPEAIGGVLLHEVGHTLRIGHIHQDPRSVMSYLNHNRHGGAAAELSASDLTSCNEAMKAAYGVDWQPPAHLQSERATMTDQEAVDAIRRAAAAR